MKCVFAVIVILLLALPIVGQDVEMTSGSMLFEDSSGLADPVKTLETGVSMYPLSPERYEKLVSYSRFNNVWRFVSFGLSLLTMGIILFTGLGARFRDWATKIKPRFFAVWLFLILVLVTDYILSLPFSIYRSFIVESDYGFMNQTFMQWWRDDLIGLALVLAIGVVPMWFFYRLIEKYRRWWLYFSIGTIPFLVLTVVIVPVVVSPMFNEFQPLQDEGLETEIRAMAAKGGIGDADIFQVDGSTQSSKINAYVTGLFGSKRIVLYDTMIKNFTHDEIKFVMGHEMAHYVMHHIWQGLVLTVLFLTFALWLMNKTIHSVIRRFKRRFGFDSLSDIASLPLVMIFAGVIFFLFQPVTNGFSRHNEHLADEYGMQISGVSGETAAIAFDKLSVYNLSDPDPGAIVEFWFYSHPALNKRMAFVRNWEK